MEKNVSIPNGMEFYKLNIILGARKRCCFNSQRDGILRWLRITLSCITYRFNSQRDGILPDKGFIIRRLYLVSIPNGMEFYLFLWRYCIVSILFQFPTGWNSTNDTNVRSKDQREFQFPTGWNSTI